MADEHAGSPDTSGVVFGAYDAQSITFPAAGSWDRVRAAFSTGGTARVGFSRTQPTNTDAVIWACYADVTTIDGWVEATMGTPLNVSAGETVWMVCRGGTQTTNLRATAKSGSSPTGGVTIGGALGASSSGGTLSGSADYFLNIQAVRAAVAPTLVSDTFARTDGAALGSADTGQPWSAFRGSPALSGGALRFGTVSTQYQWARVDAGGRVDEIEFTLSSTAGYATFGVGTSAALSLSANLNGGVMGIYSGEFGADVAGGGYSVGGNAGDVIRVVLNRTTDQLTAYVNGLSKGAMQLTAGALSSLPAGATSAYLGGYIDGSTFPAFSFDNLVVRGVAAAPAPSGQLWPRRKLGAPPASGQLWPRG